MSLRGQDWSKQFIRAQLLMKGVTMRQLSVDAGLKKDTLKNALHRPWPKGELIIAEALGVNPEVIWPSRYGIESSASNCVAEVA
ncbi:MAG: helix-turn-helix domain-containing protein [Aeromonas veronii]